MFHGNGGNVGHRIPLAKVFFAKMRCNVLMVSYRGYVHRVSVPQSIVCIYSSSQNRQVWAVRRLTVRERYVSVHHLVVFEHPLIIRRFENGRTVCARLCKITSYVVERPHGMCTLIDHEYCYYLLTAGIAYRFCMDSQLAELLA